MRHRKRDRSCRKTAYKDVRTQHARCWHAHAPAPTDVEAYAYNNSTCWIGCETRVCFQVVAAPGVSVLSRFAARLAMVHLLVCRMCCLRFCHLTYADMSAAADPRQAFLMIITTVSAHKAIVPRLLMNLLRRCGALTHPRSHVKQRHDRLVDSVGCFDAGH